MGEKRIQVGQVLKQDETGEMFLVTQLYTEALTTYAVLRKTGAETESRIRVRVQRSGNGHVIPGFSHTQNSDDF